MIIKRNTVRYPDSPRHLSLNKWLNHNLIKVDRTNLEVAGSPIELPDNKTVYIDLLKDVDNINEGVIFLSTYRLADGDYLMKVVIKFDARLADLSFAGEVLDNLCDMWEMDDYPYVVKNVPLTETVVCYDIVIAKKLAYVNNMFVLMQFNGCYNREVIPFSNLYHHDHDPLAHLGRLNQFGSFRKVCVGGLGSGIIDNNSKSIQDIVSQLMTNTLMVLTTNGNVDLSLIVTYYDYYTHGFNARPTDDDDNNEWHDDALSYHAFISYWKDLANTYQAIKKENPNSSIRRCTQLTYQRIYAKISK